MWVTNPIIFINAFLTLGKEENLIELRSDLVLKNYIAEKLQEFWFLLRNQYCDLIIKAIKSLLPFGSSYLYEFHFSAFTVIKSKKKEHLLKCMMTVCLWKIESCLLLSLDAASTSVLFSNLVFQTISI